MRRGRHVRVGDRLLTPVRGTVHRRDGHRGLVHVLVDKTGEIETFPLGSAIAAERERIYRCRDCGDWRFRVIPCSTCKALARANDAPGGYGDDARRRWGS
ncbi:hypothetical protein SEA_SOOS_8 [Gordonia phage Soos]|nr:hypothetical protein SEA_SOOS_8 [Gordonia phage Soos]